MTASITELPRLRALAPIDIRMEPREVALALGGTGESIQHRHLPYYRCRCPLCDGPVRVARGMDTSVDVDCQSGCALERVAAELIRRGLFTCRDARRWA